VVHPTVRVELKGGFTMTGSLLHTNIVVWVGIAFCISQSAVFSGLNLALFRPIIVTDIRTPLGSVMGSMNVKAEHPEDDVIDNDLILVWGEEKRIITGADLLGRLLRGIVTRDAHRAVDSR
jgi:hypothetical protein